MFSHRSGRNRTPNALAELLARSPAPRFDLCGSNPTRAGFPLSEPLLRALELGLSRSRTYAPQPFGLPEARAAVSRHFAASRGLAGAPHGDDILLTASTSEAYSFLFKLLCDPGDQVLVPAPSYPLFEHLAELESVRLAPYRLAYDGAWHIDLDALVAAVTPRSRAVIVVSPNNPTGQYVSAAELAAVARLGLPVISDEVFFEFPLLDAPRAAVTAPGLCFVLGGLSKLVGAPQLKLAWTVIAGPEAARHEARARLELIADTFLSVSAPIQHALPEILAAAPELTRSIRGRCCDNLAQLGQVLDGSSLTPLRVEGGWSAVVRLPNLLGEDELVLGLLRDEGVLVQPGWFYDFESAPFVILSLLTEPSTFAAGVAGLRRYVTRLEA